MAFFCMWHNQDCQDYQDHQDYQDYQDAV